MASLNILTFAGITIGEKNIRYMIRFGNVKVCSIGVDWADLGYVGLGKVFSSRRSLCFCSFSSVVYQDVLGGKIVWMVMGVV